MQICLLSFSILPAHPLSTERLHIHKDFSRRGLLQLTGNNLLGCRFLNRLDASRVREWRQGMEVGCGKQSLHPVQIKIGM